MKVAILSLVCIVLLSAEDTIPEELIFSIDSMYAEAYFGDSRDFRTDVPHESSPSHRSHVLSGVFFMLFVGGAVGLAQNNNPD
ncbi:hypothetical protein [Chitinivibrio alkaliphilus]|uniref:Uncharacterized protein n=1 Tax=Chitinivibrio alkaliphilus ACht1 TaxID=1313304 RepID=U7D9D3_9BACT|nr:hypothetical protein [Chitinivibrio alkaliphilus]ERP32191.1 hypothetical protein CALK_0922 [Chitinivibrio alkaliphilus ACht1]